MAFLSISNVSIKGISACVPQVIDNNCIVCQRGYEHFVEMTGIERRRIADSSTCSSDLCLAAAEKLIEELGWAKDSIDVLVFVSQTPDYILPATSPILQERLGLSERCYTLDILLGCSGWVYALSVITSLMQNGSMKRGLLLAGDTILKFCSKGDKSTYPLFGDAGTATALVYQEGSAPLRYAMNSDGKGKEAILIQDGGCRNPVSKDSFEVMSYSEGIKRNRLNLELDGMSVFSFGIQKAPKSVNSLIEHWGIDKESIDCFTFHQANKFMNEKIRKKLKLSDEKVPYSLKDFGNTSCSSIPLTLVTERGEALRTQRMSHIACGFGVGLSWGSVHFETNRIICPDLIEL